MKHFLISLFTFFLGLGTQRYMLDTPSSSTESAENHTELDTDVALFETNGSSSQNYLKKIKSLKSRITAHKKDNDSLKEQLNNSKKMIASLNKQLQGEPPLSPEEDTIELRQSFANDFFEKIRIKDQLTNSLKHSMSMISKDASDKDKEKMNELYQKYFGWEKVGKDFLSVYTDIFSASELQEISQFYSSRVGRLLTDRQEELQTKMIKAMQNYMQGPEVQEFQKEMSKLSSKSQDSKSQKSNKESL